MSRLRFSDSRTLVGFTLVTLLISSTQLSAQTTTRVSLTTGGYEVPGPGLWRESGVRPLVIPMTRAARFVAWHESNTRTAIYDRLTGQTVSVPVFVRSMSGDARYLTFNTFNTGTPSRVYVHDRLT